MNIYESIYLALIFVVFIPGILFSLPPGGSKLIVAVTHAIAFVVIYRLTADTVLDMLGVEEEEEEEEGFRALSKAVTIAKTKLEGKKKRK